MATLKEWDETIARMSENRRSEMHTAICTLLRWPFFEKEYKELNTLVVMLELQD